MPRRARRATRGDGPSVDRVRALQSKCRGENRQGVSPSRADSRAPPDASSGVTPRQRLKGGFRAHHATVFHVQGRADPRIGTANLKHVGPVGATTELAEINPAISPESDAFPLNS